MVLPSSSSHSEMIFAAAVLASANRVLFATTFDRFKRWDSVQSIRVLEMPYVAPAKHSNLDELRRVLRILKAARKENVLLLNSSSGRFHPDTLALAILGLLPGKKRPKIALMGDMWQPNTGLRHVLDRWIVRLADRAVDRYIVYSSEEVEEFPRFWGLDKSKVRCSPYFYSLTKEELNEPEPPQGDHIFAGGNSHRDYASLVEAARRMPDHRFIFATHRLQDVPNLPSNVEARLVSHKEFVRLMRSSIAVVTPIKKGLLRAAGQQTYLNAMLLRKPVIVNDTFGVRDHISNGIDGLVVDGSPQSYVDALNWVLDPKNTEAVAKMCAVAHRNVADRFSHRQHLENTVKLLQQDFGL